ncbi:MAG: hypothetical protein HKL87_07605 [Acidimicrobiaceae bacterium]|nr:hypothetical protein [Acidimicrobiaceae bacterium]
MHAQGFVECWNSVRNDDPQSFLDLGSGGGVPGFILATTWSCRAVLLDSMIRRTSLLEESSRWEGAPPTLEVVNGRAEDVGRLFEYRESFDLVVSRSFGPPAVTAECAAPFIAVGGYLVVSEPPDDQDDERWSSTKLNQLSLENLGRVRFGSAFQILRKFSPIDAKFPRKVGVPAKQPLF